MKTLLTVLLPLAFAGCTTMSLQRHTVSQSQSAADYRYQATLHALAMVAASPATLPAFALLSSGTTSVSNSGVLTPTTTLKGNSLIFASEALAFTGTHAPQISWTVSPVADYTQLEAMRCACRWVLAGPEQCEPDCLHILADPEKDMSPGPHFGVANRLERLPHGWLRVGRLCDVPAGALYQDHCGDTWVWITPDGLEGLAGFTLVLQDIATLNVTPSDGSTPTSKTPPVLVTLWLVQNTLPHDVIVNIKTTNNVVTYRAADDGANRSGSIVVAIGQALVLRNNDTETHTVEISTQPATGAVVLETATIEPAASARIICDQTMYTKAAGKPELAVRLKFKTDGVGNADSTMVLTNDQFRSAYSPTKTFRVDREIKPGSRLDIEKKMNAGLARPAPMKPVNIPWDKWMEWTTPYHGPRTSAKPGAATTTPTTQPPSRLARPTAVTNAEGLEIGGVLSEYVPAEPGT